MTTTAQEQFTIAAKTRLLKQRKTITQFASEVGRARNTVSQAINHPAYYPKLAPQLAKALGIGAL